MYHIFLETSGQIQLTGGDSMYHDRGDSMYHDHHQEDQDDQECPPSTKDVLDEHYLQYIPMYHIFLGTSGQIQLTGGDYCTAAAAVLPFFLLGMEVDKVQNFQKFQNFRENSKNSTFSKKFKKFKKFKIFQKVQKFQKIQKIQDFQDFQKISKIPKISKNPKI